MEESQYEDRLMEMAVQFTPDNQGNVIINPIHQLEVESRGALAAMLTNPITSVRKYPIFWRHSRKTIMMIYARLHQVLLSLSMGN